MPTPQPSYPSGRPKSRREFLLKSAAGALTLSGLALRPGLTYAAASPTLTPGLTEGPYWVDELLVRSDVRSDPTTGIVQPGVPLILQVAINQYTGGKIVPLAGAYVDIWHANAAGVYSDEQANGTLGEKFLRGLQTTSSAGAVQFTTIYPGWYSGRTTHIHLRVRVPNAAKTAIAYNFVTQLFFMDWITNNVYSLAYPYDQRSGVRDTVNATDGIYRGPSSDGEIASGAGNYLVLNISQTKTYFLGKFTVLMNLADAGYNNPLG